MPLVGGFGQDIRYTVDRSGGAPRRELAHVLKVFLIDPAGYVAKSIRPRSCTCARS
jgi:hypothetical protein